MNVAIPILIVVFIFTLFTLVVVYSSRVKKVGPNQVLVISGRRREMVNPVTGNKERVGFRVVKGGGSFIIPVLERVDILSMEILTIEVEVRSVYTVEGVPVHVDGVAQIKIRGEQRVFLPKQDQLEILEALDEEVVPEYRDMVAEYFKTLSQSR